MKNTIILYLIILSLAVALSSCKENPLPPEDQPQVNLTLEDTSCTEVWLELKSANISLPTEVILKQDDSIAQTISLNSPDTLLYIDSLLPNHTYKFQSGIQSVSQSSNPLTVSTLDTTSHNFTFESFTFGGTAGSSTFYDVAIIDENDIWAVGEIYVADTSQNGYTRYNAVHWDGIRWELKKINMSSSCNPVTYPPLKAILAFSTSNIVVTSGGSIGWFNSITNVTDCSIGPLLSGSLNKLWGANNNNLYAVGNAGSIVHYQNGQWSKVESGTDVDLKDIYGSPDGKELWTCGWSNPNGRVAIIKINDNGVESIWDSQTNREFSYYYEGQLLNTLWANGNEEFVFATGVVTRHSLLNKKLVRFDWVPFLNGVKVLELGNYAYRIRGSNKNNIYIIGDEAMIWHYNGVTWHKFEEFQNVDDRLYDLTVTENLIVTVGIGYGNGLGEALILIGRR